MLPGRSAPRRPFPGAGRLPPVCRPCGAREPYSVRDGTASAPGESEPGWLLVVGCWLSVGALQFGPKEPRTNNQKPTTVSHALYFASVFSFRAIPRPGRRERLI